MKRQALIVLILSMVVSTAAPLAGESGGTSYIIVHAHNPEGVEIASIQGMGPYSVQIYDGETFIGYGAYNAASHNQPITISTGTHTIKAKFNGITMEQSININEGETQVLTFTFERRVWDFITFLNGIGHVREEKYFCHETQGGIWEIVTWLHEPEPPYPSKYINTNCGVYTEQPETVSGTLYGDVTITSNSVDFELGLINPQSSGEPWAFGGGWMEYIAAIDEFVSNPPNFTNWYIQNEPTSNVGGNASFCLFDDPYFFITNTIDYRLNVRNVSPYLLGIHIEIYRSEIQLPYFYINSEGNFFHNTYHEIFTHDKVYISSVPYDLLGTGVKGQPPVASFTYSPEKPMVGGNIEFDASQSTGTIAEYCWDFNDGTPVETVSVPKTSHVFSNANVFDVNLTVRDNMGQTASLTKSLDLSLRIGDIFLCRTDRSYVPGKTWGHAGIYAGKRDFDGADVIIEGLLEPDGAIVVSPITRWSWPEMTYVCVLRPEVEYWEAQAAVDFASSQIGRPFDSWRIIKQVCHITNKVWNAPSWYCSELVWAAYMNATNGICDLDMPFWMNGNAITPDEIYYSSRVQLIGEHKEETPETFWSFYRLIGGVAYCPVELSITDPSGRHLEVNINEIPGSIYEKGDFNGDGEMDVFFAIPNPKTGDYKIMVIADSNALPTDTYSLEAIINGQTMVLAQDVQIADIPAEPYVFESKLNYADFDNDGDVDFYDYAAFASRWMSADCHYPDWCEGKDLDYSGLVDFMDLSIFTDNWLWGKNPADLDIDGDVDFVDYSVLANQWMAGNCTEPAWCEGADLNKSGSVDLYDLGKFADNWLEGTTP